MSRVNVYSTDTDQQGQSTSTLAGWFDYTKAERWTDADYNGNGSGGTGRGEAVMRTSGGRWVLQHWSRWQGEENLYEYITEDAAKDWLLRNSEDTAVERYFGEIEDEAGPGRPEIGSAVHVRLGDLIEAVDAYAEKAGVKRAEAIRRLVSAGLKGTE